MARFAGFLIALWVGLPAAWPSPAISAVLMPSIYSSHSSRAQLLLQRGPAGESIAQHQQTPAPAPDEVEDLTEPDPSQSTDGETPPSDEVSIGEIPVIQMVELSLDAAHRAVDVYVVVKDKYKDAALENFDSLQDFVDRDPLGKAFETDIKGAGFPNVTDWNVTITTVGAAYTNIVEDQSSDIKLQIEEVQKDAELAQDMKDRIIASLNALIPSENNRTIVQQMIDDPAYAEKLKLLETEEE